jgi:membrane-bound lytic murein transglycosylase F
MYKIVKILFCVAILLSFLSCSFLKKEKDDKNTINVILQNNILGCILNDSVMQGFQYEIIKEFACLYDYQLNIIFLDNIENSIKQINNSDADVLAHALPTTIFMKKQLNFTEPLYKTKLVLIQKKYGKKDKNLLAKNIYDLESKTIFVTDTPYIRQLKYIIEDSGIKFNIAVKHKQNIEKLAEQVCDGKISYFATHELFAKYLNTKYKDIDYSMDLGLNQFMAWGINPKNKKLNEKLNIFIKDFVKSEKYRQIYRKYFY